MAIALVLLSHFQDSFGGYTGLFYPLRYFSNGGHGVAVFFVLSGYLITSILIREYDAMGGKIDIKAFYCRRILRIFPAFYAYFLLIAILAWRGDIDLSRTYLALAAAHLINYAQAIFLTFHIPEPGGNGYWWIGHFWSLSMEEQFYWMWPATLLLLLRTRWYGALAGLVLAMPVIRVASYFLCPGLRGQLMIMLHTGSDAIFAGCLLAIAMMRHPEWVRKVMVSPWVIAGLVFYFFFINYWLEEFLPGGFAVSLGVTIIIAVITVIIANVLLQEKETWYHRLLSWPALVFLGRISYSVYLWQQVFLTPMNTTWLGRCPINLLAALATGWLSYRFIETPFIQLKDHYFPAHTKRAPAVATT